MDHQQIEQTLFLCHKNICWGGGLVSSDKYFCYVSEASGHFRLECIFGHKLNRVRALILIKCELYSNEADN